MNNNTKLELISTIANYTSSNEYGLAEKLLKLLGVKIGDTVDANPADIFSSTDMLNSIEPELIADYLENEKGYAISHPTKG